MIRKWSAAMSSSPSDTHPGPHIRAVILPKDLSVTEAARLLGVGRPALSNMLNSKAALSPDMAARIERTFGASARELMDMQAAHDAAIAIEKGVASATRSYVPPFLQFKATDIEDWAKSLSARSRLAVFLRTLVHSTGS
ncbi:MAG: HigA family addiction module antitoxin [Geminicoccaceae bacterium]